ncbi:hypothetical protein BDW22DRAFT_1356923 [Trametopsis cervina]|nr:hypothetical protein BDW22DRAFT_1356923 [Trametopsis cervina]
MSGTHSGSRSKPDRRSQSKEPSPTFPTEWDPNEPLPEYTRSWDTSGHLRRPVKLPEEYDKRIDPSHIFIFSRHPITGIEKDFLVTPKPCDYCAKIRQVCSRSRPICHRCSATGDPNRLCTVEKGWVKLPGPKCVKPKLKGRTLTQANEDSDATPSSTRSLPPRKAKLHASASRENGSVPRSGSGTPVVSSRAGSAEPPNKRRRTLPAAETMSLSVTSATPQRDVNLPSGDVEQEQRVSHKSASGSKRKTSRRTVVPQNTLAPGSWQAKDGTLWKSVRPPQTSQTTRATQPISSDVPQGLSTKPPPPEKPRIWASSKQELLEILPELSRAINANGSGIFKEDMTLEPPLIFLEGTAWPEDRWNSRGIIELSIEREFTIPPNIGQNAGGVGVDYQDSVDVEMELLDETERPPNNGPDPPKNDEPLDRMVCHPSALLKGKTDTNVSSTPVPQNVSQETNSIPHSYNTYPLLTPNSTPHIYNSHQLQPASSTPHSYNNHHPQTASSTPHLYTSYPWQSKPAVPQPAPPSLTGAFAKRDSSRASYTFPLQAQVQNHPLFATARNANGQLQSQNRTQEHASTNGRDRCRLRPATFGPTPLSRALSMDDSSDEDEVNDFRRYLSRDQRIARRAKKFVSHGLSKAISDMGKMLPPDHPYRLETERTLPELDRNAAKALAPKPPLTTWDYRQVVMPSELPPEVQHLEECQLYGIPVSIVVNRDSNLLPFSLSKEFGVVYLGFFKLSDSKHTILSSRMEAADGSLTATVRWHYRFEWIPGGDAIPEGTDQPTRPWWSPNIVSEEEPTLYSLLPMHLSSDFARFGGHHVPMSSEVNNRLGWHCASCGRLNVQRQLCFQQCSSCGTGNGLTAVGSMYVRDPHRMSPDSRPVDTYPNGVACDILDAGNDGMRTFVYTVRRNVTIKHLFTCNRSTVQKTANQFFSDVQMQVPLTWQSAKTVLASGPYFTYLAGSGHEGGAHAVPWDQVPACVSAIRSTMCDLAAREARHAGLQIDQMTMLGWHTSGNRKGPVIPATKTTVTLLCLGADVELSIVPRGGFEAVIRERPTPNTVVEDPAPENRDEFQPYDPDDTEEEDVPLSISTKGAVEPKKMNSPIASLSVVGSADGSRDKKLKKRPERMFVTLVHGDMLLLSGDEFECSIHRTGMSILAIGSESPYHSETL